MEVYEPLPGGVESGAIIIVIAAILVIAAVAYLAFRQR